MFKRVKRLCNIGLEIGNLMSYDGRGLIEVNSFCIMNASHLMNEPYG